MIVLNRRDGRTERFDLGDEDDARRLNGVGNDPKAAAEITGFSLKSEGRSTTLPTPKRFRRVSFWGEVVKDGEGKAVGERLTIQADDVEVAATVWASSGSAKLEVWRKGRRVFSPAETEAL